MSIFSCNNIKPLFRESVNNLLVQFEGQETNEPVQVKSYLVGIEALFKQTNKRPVDPNRVIYHFLLDKLWTKKHINDPFELEYHGSRLHIQAVVLSKNLQKLIKTLDKNVPSDIHKKIEEILRSCCNSLDFAAKIGRIIALENLLTAANVIAETIKSVAFPVLIPCGSKKHSTSISVEITGPGKVRLALFNTGNGTIPYHHWLSDNHYLTYRMIENVPIEDVLDPDNWRKILDAKNNEDINYLYDAFDNHLGANGILRKATENPNDYEQKQMRGTCAAQNLMSFVRFQILENIPGNDLEKMGVYKFVKAKILIQIGNRYKARCEEQIKRLVGLKLNKHMQESMLVKLIDDDHFPEIYKQLTLLFEKLENEVQIGFDQLKSFGSRYHFLRFSCQYLAKKAIEERFNCQLIEQLPEIKSYTTSIFIDKFYSLSNIKNLLEEYEIIEDWDGLAKTLGKMLLGTPYHSPAIGWLTKPENASSGKPVMLKLLKDLSIIPVLKKLR